MKRVLFFIILAVFCMVFCMNAFAFGPVQYGDYGYEVEQVQQMLIDIGYLDGWADGQFGPITEAAVLDFQYDRGLDVDGVVGDQTYNELVWLTSGSVPAASEGWQYDGYGWWYLNADWTYPVSTWVYIDGDMYHFDDEGYMDTGWLWDGCWYYMDSNGARHTGWLEYAGDWYYFNFYGIMLTGTHVIDGIECVFDGEGVLIEENINTTLVTDAYFTTYYDVYGTHDYHVPQINISGYEMDVLNREMYKQYVFYVNEGIWKAEQGDGIIDITGISYEWYVNGDILSLVVKCDWLYAMHTYYVYNISIFGGYQLDDDYIYGLYGLSYEQYYDMMAQRVTAELDSCWSESYASVYPSDLEESLEWISLNSRVYIGDDWSLCALAQIKNSLSQNGYYTRMYILE